MATTFANSGVARSDNRFFFIVAVAMALVLVAGFSMQLAMGRSSFGAPAIVHLHALTFFGWTVFYVFQTGLAASGSLVLHRRLGWIGGIWSLVLVAVGITTTAVMVRRGGVPFFFTPLGFLVMNSLSVMTAAGLVWAGVAMRRRTEWHRRLICCGMAVLTGPGFGRLLPVPFLIPWVDWAVFATVMIFPLVGVIGDLRRHGAVHPAWWVGIATMTGFQIISGLFAHSAAGLALYGVLTAGSPGAAVAPLAFPPMPPL